MRSYAHCPVLSQHAQKHKMTVVRTYCGHGINELFHCAPNVPHYSSTFCWKRWSLTAFCICQLPPRSALHLHPYRLTENKAVGTMKPGHTFTIEPMICLGMAWGLCPKSEYTSACSASGTVSLLTPPPPLTLHNSGSWQDVTWPDNWTATTVVGVMSSFHDLSHPCSRSSPFPRYTFNLKDGKRSAQFEHTLLVTETGIEILTARTPDSPST